MRSPYWPPIRLLVDPTASLGSRWPANDETAEAKAAVEDLRYTPRSLVLHLVPVPDGFPVVPDLGPRVRSVDADAREIWRLVAAGVIDDVAYRERWYQLYSPDAVCPPGDAFGWLPTLYPALHQEPGMCAANMP